MYLKHWDGTLEEVVAWHYSGVEEDVVLDDVAHGEYDGEADAGDGDQPHRSVYTNSKEDIVTLEEQKPVWEETETSEEMTLKTIQAHIFVLARSADLFIDVVSQLLYRDKLKYLFYVA